MVQHAHCENAEPRLLIKMVSWTTKLFSSCRGALQPIDTMLSRAIDVTSAHGRQASAAGITLAAALGRVAHALTAGTPASRAALGAFSP